ncbi:hypothetical protein O0J71_18290, partial [Stenotrophomonas sp. Sm3119]|uniref:hypothetical protein n=1 Tax=Stenotrophomonas sp. Sm3119 TaxID=3002744 RepID=UPI0027E415F2
AVAHKHLGHCHQLWRPSVYERLAGPDKSIRRQLIFAAKGQSRFATIQSKLTDDLFATADVVVPNLQTH